MSEANDQISSCRADADADPRDLQAEIQEVLRVLGTLKVYGGAGNAAAYKQGLTAIAAIFGLTDEEKASLRWELGNNERNLAEVTTRLAVSQEANQVLRGNVADAQWMSEIRMDLVRFFDAELWTYRRAEGVYDVAGRPNLEMIVDLRTGFITVRDTKARTKARRFPIGPDGLTADAIVGIAGVANVKYEPRSTPRRLYRELFEPEMLAPRVLIPTAKTRALGSFILLVSLSEETRRYFGMG